MTASSKSALGLVGAVGGKKPPAGADADDDGEGDLEPLPNAANGGRRRLEERVLCGLLPMGIQNGVVHGLEGDALRWESRSEGLPQTATWMCE